MSNKFLDSVTQAIRDFVDPIDSEVYEALLETSDDLHAKVNEMISAASIDDGPDMAQKVWQTGYDYASTKMDLFSEAVKLLSVVRIVHQEILKEAEHKALQLAVEQRTLPSKKPPAKSGTVGVWDDRQEFLEESHLIAQDIEQKQVQDVVPARIQYNKINIMLRGLARNSLAEFPMMPKDVPAGLKKSDRVVVLSPAQAKDGGARYFALRCREAYKERIHQAQVRLEAKERRERKKEQRKLEGERLAPLMKLREERAIHETVEVPITTPDRK